MTERWATFDCYGTLIDWMGGIRTALARTFPDRDAAALLQRFHEIEPLVQKYREYKGVEDEIRSAEELIKGSDPEMRDLALEELNELNVRKGRISDELKILLIPKDPNDERNVLLEIRAGTGGEEAALFAGDLPTAMTWLAGLAAMVVSQAAMVAVMTMTPPHMKDHGHSDLSAYVIALHICGMYGLAPVVGRFVARTGAVRAVMVGAVVLGSGTVLTVLGGYVPAFVFVGLFLLGLGWNIGLIAGSSILTSAVPVGSRVEVQGTADLTMSFCGGIAAFSSGFIKAAWGFHLLADAASVAAGLLLVAAYVHTLRSRPVLPTI